MPKPLLDLMRSMKATRWQVFRRVRMPMAVPHFMVGCRTAVTFAALAVLTLLSMLLYHLVEQAERLVAARLE